jgi:hypothetical protein
MKREVEEESLVKEGVEVRWEDGDEVRRMGFVYF